MLWEESIGRAACQFARDLVNIRQSGVVALPFPTKTHPKARRCPASGPSGPLGCLRDGKTLKCRRERDVILTRGRQHSNRKSGPDYSARYPVLLSRRVVIAKSLW